MKLNKEPNYEYQVSVVFLTALRSLVESPTPFIDTFSRHLARDLLRRSPKMITGTFSFDYSLKCIPNASKLQLQKILVSSIESLLNRMRWKLFWAKSPPLERRNKETFGFKSCNKAPFDPDLMRFEKDLIKIVPELEIRKANTTTTCRNR